jgi:hypothetical protein
MGFGESKYVFRSSGPSKVKCLFLALALLVALASGDVVIMHSGQVAGTVVGSDSLTVSLRTRDGKFQSLAKKDIIEVLVSKGSRIDSLFPTHPGLTVIFDPTATTEDSMTGKPLAHKATCCGVPCCLGSGCLPAAEVVSGGALIAGVYVLGGPGSFLVLTAPFAVAGLTTVIGKRTAPGGSFGTTCFGSYLGDLGGVILGVGVSTVFEHGEALENYVLVGGLIGTIPGSIIGYNLSRRHRVPPVAPPRPAKPKPVRLGRSPVAWVALTGLELGTGLAAGIALAQPGLALTNRQSPVGYGLAALAPAAAAGGTALIGAWLDRKGSAWWALPGAYSGAIGGLLIAALAAKGLPAFSNASLYAMPFLPMWLGSGLGAVAGYRMGPSLGAMESASRFEPASLGLAFKPDRSRRSQRVAEVKANLLTYRF